MLTSRGSSSRRLRCVLAVIDPCGPTLPRPPSRERVLERAKARRPPRRKLGAQPRVKLGRVVLGRRPEMFDDDGIYDPESTALLHQVEPFQLDAPTHSQGLGKGKHEVPETRADD